MDQKLKNRIRTHIEFNCGSLSANTREILYNSIIQDIELSEVCGTKGGEQ